MKVKLSCKIKKYKPNCKALFGLLVYLYIWSSIFGLLVYLITYTTKNMRKGTSEYYIARMGQMFKISLYILNMRARRGDRNERNDYIQQRI